MAQQMTRQRNQAKGEQDRNRNDQADAGRNTGPMAEKGTKKAPHGLRHQEHEYKKGDTGGCCRGY